MVFPVANENVLRPSAMITDIQLNHPKPRKISKRRLVWIVSNGFRCVADEHVLLYELYRFRGKSHGRNEERFLCFRLSFTTFLAFCFVLGYGAAAVRRTVHYRKFLRLQTVRCVRMSRSVCACVCCDGPSLVLVCLFARYSVERGRAEGRSNDAVAERSYQ